MHVKKKLGFSERRICKVLMTHRSLLRYQPVNRDFQNRLKKRVVEVASEYGRYGYRQVTGILNMEGWDVGKDRVFTIWQQEGLKIPQKQPKRARLWLADGSSIRQRPEYVNHVWSYDFVSEETYDGRKFRILNIIDEYSRECLASIVARKIRSGDVIQALADLFLKRGIPKHIRSDNGPEFVATKLRMWLKSLDVKPLFIFPGSPWENGYCESFNGKMRYELLNGEIFFSLLEAKVIIEQWRVHYNTKRPHSALGYKAPAPLAFQQDFRRVLAATKT
jgi:transposase InsO family protein